MRTPLALETYKWARGHGRGPYMETSVFRTKHGGFRAFVGRTQEEAHRKARADKGRRPNTPRVATMVAAGSEARP